MLESVAPVVVVATGKWSIPGSEEITFFGLANAEIAGGKW